MLPCGVVCCVSDEYLWLSNLPQQGILLAWPEDITSTSLV